MHASLPPHFFSQKASKVLHFGNVRRGLQPQFGGQLLKCRTKVWQNQKSHFLPICPRTETSIIYGMISPKLRCKCSIQGVLFKNYSNGKSAYIFSYLFTILQKIYMFTWLYQCGIKYALLLFYSFFDEFITEDTVDPVPNPKYKWCFAACLIFS